MGNREQFMMGNIPDESVINDWIKETEIRREESRAKPKDSGVSWFWFMVAFLFLVD